MDALDGGGAFFSWNFMKTWTLPGECVNWNASPSCDSAMISQALGRLQNRWYLQQISTFREPRKVVISILSRERHRHGLPPWFGHYRIRIHFGYPFEIPTQEVKSDLMDLLFLFAKSLIFRDHGFTSPAKIRYAACIQFVFEMVLAKLI